MIKIVNLLSKPQKGFGLIEVLITVVILAIGLLGLAGLQASGRQSWRQLDFSQ